MVIIEKHFTYIDAVLSLVPLAKFYPSESGNYEDAEWVDVRERPTKEAVDAEIIRLQNEWTRTEYQRQIAPEYPPIGDQLDALFHAGAFTPEMTAIIQAVKDKYPKPN